MDEKALVVISNRQTHMLNFWQSMEAIRWRFTSTFGLGAVTALFLSIDQVNREKSLIPLILLFTLCVASIICQLRIYVVLHSVWAKIILLQKLEINILRQLDKLHPIAEENEAALYLPESLSSNIKLFSITAASCSVFIFFATSAIYLSMRIFDLDSLWSLVFSGLFLLITLKLMLLALNKLVKPHHSNIPNLP